MIEKLFKLTEACYISATYKDHIRAKDNIGIFKTLDLIKVPTQ